MCWLRSLRALFIALSMLALPTASRADANSRERHDGFYLRLAVGPGSLDVERRTDHLGAAATTAFSGDTSSVSGWGPFGEVSVGGTPGEHLVLAGTLLGGLLPAPVLVVGGGPRVNLAGPLTAVLLAPTVDIFPDSFGGLHFGGGAGIARATVRIEDASFHGIGGTGVGFTAHFGFDFWTADEWAVGVLGRATFAFVGSERTASGITGHEHDTVSSVGFSATLLYH